MRAILPKFVTRIFLLAVLTLLGGLLSATLVRFAPGYGIDERELDPRLSQASVEALRSSRRINSGIVAYYGRYLSNLIRGDFGTSQWLGRPVRALVQERLPVTARSVLIGMLLAWVAALACVLATYFPGGVLLSFPGTTASGVFIALPTGVVAMFAVYLRAPAFVAIAVVLFPKLFRYVRNLLADAYSQPHVLATRARGVTQTRLVFRHVLPMAAPALLALFGVSLSMAFGAAIPIEALCDSPGLGQLAWQAALNRDLPLIMNITLLITLLTVIVNSLAGLVAAPHQRPA
jgi:peptide/nickel transport system permease protein